MTRVATADRICFSIITVTKNAADHIVRCLDSVARQTFANVEHVVVDGASSDGTQALVATYGRRVTRLISEPDRGIYDAMNKGLMHASGDFILFLGADDFLYDDQVLADVADFLAQENIPEIVYGDLHVRHDNGTPTVFQPPPPDQALEFMISGCLPHQATFAHRSVFLDKVGVFDTRYRVQADYDWFLRVLATDSLRIQYVERVISSYFTGGASSRLEIGQKETYEIQNLFPIYRQPEWVEKRLHEFQQRVLDYRSELQRLRRSTHAKVSIPWPINLAVVKDVARQTIQRLRPRR